MTKWISLTLCSILLAACAPSTPQARIAAHPEKFASLGTQEQSLVTQGQIAPGMSTDAVWLAWGSPDRRFDGSRDSRMTERWDYATTVPVHTPMFMNGAWGSGCGRFGPHGRRSFYGGGFGFGPDITYIPQRVASVWFVDRRVDSWERLR
ncbi:MAG: hypothetical protein ACRDBP_05730 [Luteolibacter sp.]